MYAFLSGFERGAYKVMEGSEVHSQTDLQPANHRDQLNRWSPER